MTFEYRPGAVIEEPEGKLSRQRDGQGQSPRVEASWRVCGTERWPMWRCSESLGADGEAPVRPCGGSSCRSEVEPRDSSSAVPGAAFRPELPLQLLVDNKPQGLGEWPGCAITGHQAPRVGAGWK